MEVQFTFINFLSRGGVFSNSCGSFILTLGGQGAELVLKLPVSMRRSRLGCGSSFSIACQGAESSFEMLYKSNRVEVFFINKSISQFEILRMHLIGSSSQFLQLSKMFIKLYCLGNVFFSTFPINLCPVNGKNTTYAENGGK